MQHFQSIEFKHMGGRQIILIIADKSGLSSRLTTELISKYFESPENVSFIVFERSTDFLEVLDRTSSTHGIAHAIFLLGDIRETGEFEAYIPTSTCVFISLIMEWLESNNVPYSFLT